MFQTGIVYFDNIIASCFQVARHGLMADYLRKGKRQKPSCQVRGADAAVHCLQQPVSGTQLHMRPAVSCYGPPGVNAAGKPVF